MSYAGETLWIGYACRLLIIAGFVAAIMGSLSYFLAFQNRAQAALDKSWQRLGHIGAAIHGVSILSLIGLIFFSMITRKYEYNYVFEHVSDDLPMRYILSAFWEGQEGSFMLWMFWHIVLGTIIWFTDKKWRVPVLSVLLLVEVCLNSMILGIYLPFTLDDIRIGSNPMVLIRENMEAPIFQNAQYLSLIKGRGLNPLLQNYWNTIHPPTLFLGFASTVVPFAYAIAGLWSKEDKAWLKSGLKWSLFSGGILGIGILMGSFWAYEALSFGGYWAWDPVENSSLVPWIIMIAGIHTHLIAKNTGAGLRSTYLFYILSFVLVLYSTLLTRSGILGDTSAHAFTEMGLEWQLTGFLLIFLLGGISLLLFRVRTIQEPTKEESMWSREFWMYVGALILAFSGILITASTSLPVYNTIIKIFKPDYAGMVLQDPIEHYNRYQLWIGVLVSFLSGFAIFLRYKLGKFTRAHAIQTGFHLLLAGILTYLVSRWIALPQWQMILMAFAGLYVVVSSIEYLFRVASKNIRLGASGFSHLGFGLMLVGLLASGGNSYHLNNPFLFKGLSDEEGFEEKYVQLIKNKPLLVRGHMVTYESDTLIDRERFYTLDFKKIDKDLKVLDSFKLYPNAMYSNDFAKVAAFNPDTKHYFGRDVFTCVVNIPSHLTDAEKLKEMEDTIKYEQIVVAPGDTVEFNTLKFVFGKVDLSPQSPDYLKSENDLGLEIPFEVYDEEGTLVDKSYTTIGMKGALVYKYPAKLESEGMRIRPSELTIDEFVSPEDDLQYETFDLKQGDSFTFGDFKIKLAGFDRNVKHVNYQAEEGDLAIAALLEIEDKNGAISTQKPVYIIRGNRPFGLKDYDINLGLHSRLIEINPSDERFTIKVAKDQRNENKMVMELATNVPRSDYLILEAKVFPGINYFWAGCLLMMIGLLMAWYFKLKEPKKQTA
ncbi:MAG TPA: cytochrome c biogenesis protein CcsA [Saprospiraceae bacterium]|nr:cytochrome c biogenesis protein CcsA [Saprospiraceae bacterium]